MKKLRKFLLPLLIFLGFFAIWYFADKEDYFQSGYKELSAAQQIAFKWQDGDDAEKLMNRYRQYFFDKEYAFPRQKVTQVKHFANVPMFSVFTSKTLKSDYVDSFVHFCNDTANFHWGETTWGINESEYYCRLYNSDGKVVGKIYFCLDDCGMTSARPFSPSMKFGGLSAKGMVYIQQLFADKTKWE